MTGKSKATDGAEPCPVCGAKLHHIESVARSFDPPRVYHEWHHPDADCWLRSKLGLIMFTSTDVDATEAVEAWNRRAALPPPTAQLLTNCAQILDVVKGEGEAELVEQLSRAIEGVTPGPWMAHMDDFTVRFASTYIPEQRKIALCATGEGAGKNAAYIALCSPDNIAILIAELLSLRRKVEEQRRALEQIASPSTVGGMHEQDRAGKLQAIAARALAGDGP